MRPVFDAETGRESADADVARLAARQHGAFSRESAKQLGFTRGMIESRVRSGRWERLDAFTFRVAGAPPTWRQRLMVACLSWGPGTAASHASAAALRGLVGFPPGPVELTVPPKRDRIVAEAAIVHRNALDPEHVTVRGGIPATTIDRTLLDIAATEFPSRVEEALDDALNRRLISTAQIRRLVAAAGRGRPGVVLLRGLLDARDGDPVPQSVFETRLLRVLLDAGLPRPALQHPVFDATGRFLARLDFAYPDLRVGVESDGRRWHAGRIRWERDRARLNALTLAGWRIIHVTWAELNRHPDRVAARVRRALALPELPRCD